MALSLAPAQQPLPHALAPLPAPAVIGIGLAVLVIVLSNQAWAIALHLGVVAHECLAGLLPRSALAVQTGDATSERVFIAPRSKPLPPLP